jgi:hypothetical protein
LQLSGEYRTKCCLILGVSLVAHPRILPLSEANGARRWSTQDPTFNLILIHIAQQEFVT